MPFDAFDIQKYQQNRYPAFFLDSIENVIPGKYASGTRLFSENEWFSKDKADTTVPSVIVGEALEQTYLMTFLTLPENKGLKTSTVCLSAEYFKEVKFGDKLLTEAELLLNSRGLTRGTVVGKVNEEVVCKADFTVTIPAIMNNFKPKTGV